MVLVIVFLPGELVVVLGNWAQYSTAILVAAFMRLKAWVASQRLKSGRSVARPAASGRAAEQIPRPYSRAEDNARSLYGHFDCMTTTAPKQSRVNSMCLRPKSSRRRRPYMKYIGCDFHPSFQQIAMLDMETGELVERRLLHTEEAVVFYEGLQGPVVVGIEASGNTHWFESVLARCQHELWIGDAAAIARQEGRKQEHDRRAAALILKLMVENRFPRIWVPTVAERDLRQLLIHRQHLVRMRTRVKNQLQ